jgi:hypothetical protein
LHEEINRDLELVEVVEKGRKVDKLVLGYRAFHVAQVVGALDPLADLFLGS